MIYLDNNNELHATNNPQFIVVESCFQELKLWKFENQLDIERGVDYQAVFEQSVYLRTEVENVCARHAHNFKEIEVLDPTMGEDEIVHIRIVFVLLNDQVVEKSLALSLREAQ